MKSLNSKPTPGASALARAFASLPIDDALLSACGEPMATIIRAVIGASGDKVAAFLESAKAHGISDADADKLWKAAIAPDPKVPIQTTWKFYTLADAYKSRAPLTWIVDGLFAESTLNFVYGAPGTLKSLLLADCCACVASGVDWLDPVSGSDDATARKTAPGAVLWLDQDNGTRRTHERFEAIGRARALPESTPLHYLAMPSPLFDASDLDSIGNLEIAIRRIGARLIVVDNFGTVTGGSDENASEIRAITSNLRTLTESTGAAVVLVHHQRKTNGATNTRAGDSMRGHSSIEAAIDLALLVERDDLSDEMKIKSTKTRGVDVLPFGARFTFEHKPGTNELASARFFGFAVDDDASNAALSRAIVETVTGEITQTRLVAEIQGVLPKMGRDRIRTRANALVLSGKIASKQGQYHSTIYFPK